jgi:hypothetical protein
VFVTRVVELGQLRRKMSGLGLRFTHGSRIIFSWGVEKRGGEVKWMEMKRDDMVTPRVDGAVSAVLGASCMTLWEPRGGVLRLLPWDKPILQPARWYWTAQGVSSVPWLGE